MKEILKKIIHIIPFKKQVFSVLRMLHLPENIFKHLYFIGIIEVPFESHGFKMNHYGYQLENELFWKGLTNGWEKISMQLWIELSKKSSVILDIGANTGVYSLVSKAINQKAEIFAFEPVKRVFHRLEENIQLNQFDIKTFEFALSNNDGEAMIYDAPTEHVYSVAVNKNIAEIKNPIETKIEIKKLSSFIKEQNITHIDLIKLDVETHEPEVLEGMEEYLQKYKPTWLIEILTDEVGYKVQQLIKNMDYLYFNIDEIGIPKQVNEIKKSTFYNYLICSPQIAKQLNLIK